MQQMQTGKALRVILLAAVVLLAIAGCQKQEGPAERAGKEVDKTTEKMGQQIEKAGDKIQDTARGEKK